MTKMKVLLLNDNLKKGGRERRMIELIKGLLKFPSIILEVVLFKDEIEYPEIHNLNIHIHVIKRKNKILALNDLYKVTKEFQPDIVHAWSLMTNILSLPTIILQGCKLINSKVASAPNHLKWYHKEYLLSQISFLLSDVIISNSMAGLESFNAPKHKSITIYNGFDFNTRVKNLTSPEIIKKKYGIESEKIVGKVAAFADRKDYLTFIQAAIQVLEKNNGVIFFAIGEGSNLEQIKNLVPKKYINKIIFTGRLDHVESVINIFDIGVLCTNNVIHGEGISNTIMEYMALGKPVIATEGGGTNEIVVNKENGFLVPARSPQIVSNRILYLLMNKDQAADMGKTGQKNIQNKFSLTGMTKKYLDVYTKLLN